VRKQPSLTDRVSGAARNFHRSDHNGTWEILQHRKTAVYNFFLHFLWKLSLKTSMCTGFVVFSIDKKYHKFLALIILSVTSPFSGIKNYFLKFDKCVFVTFLPLKAEGLITSIVPWSCQCTVSRKRATVFAYDKDRAPLHKFCEGNLILVWETCIKKLYTT
jgi:hypothetical protein